ncbi:RabGAP/TBC domain-containing protein isoform 2 [Hibiscus syriacus]|uniref:TBC1 domain family member 15 n=1 Tax=Hibiscus syriacus TaxID=106335 RepID=A0A6A2WGI8_HIBSY|nr:TBC1 domain family member 17-like isoform X1 [Hibiscus syriacus]KAE8657883.1 RabGAP/TBC domain-containing protein isoform 2 [Hibiscus syriacus]
MQEAELHDLSDDADYVASQQQGSASMMRCDSGKRSSSSEPEGAQIVYLKDNVTIHPTLFASERISGRLKLIKQGSSIFMTWIPYKGQSTNARLSEKDRNLYTIRAVPFADVKSIKRHTPALGWQYIIVVLSFGLAFPPLYFYNGGVREFLATVKQHVLLMRSAEDSNVFLVNDFQNPLQRTLSSLELPRAVSAVGVPSTPVPVGESASQQNEERTDISASIPQYNRRQRQKGHDPARDISIQVLEKFSLVTKFARETTSQLFHETNNNGFGPLERRNSNQSTLDYSHKPSDYDEDVPIQSPVEPDPLEFDKLSLVWGKPRQPPLGLEEWTSFLDSEGRVVDPKALRKRIFYGGLEHKFRKKVWALLLGYHTYESTYAEREYQKSIKKTEYETIKNQWQSISREQAKRCTKFRERKGLIEKDVVRTDRSVSFYNGDENPNVNLLRDILLTYSFYNFDLGYCQGMSDLLSPILFVMEDESESFWCFVALMERLGPNFNRDQNGMHSQLFALSKLVELLDSPLHNYFKQSDFLNYFFCFRWILIQFKRELEYEETMRLWEVLWTRHFSEHLHLYLCVAVLKRYRSKIIGEQMDFDTLLKFINELSGQIDLDATLRDAEALCICAGENGAACIPPGTPPSLPVDDGSFYNQQDYDVL